MFHRNGKVPQGRMSPDNVLPAQVAVGVGPSPHCPLCAMQGLRLVRLDSHTVL